MIFIIVLFFIGLKASQVSQPATPDVIETEDYNYTGIIENTSNLPTISMKHSLAAPAQRQVIVGQTTTAKPKGKVAKVI